MLHTDLTPTRRAFAGLLAATSATTALATGALASEGRSPDAALLEMVDALGQATERLNKFNELTDQAMEDYVSPDIPGELKFRPADYPHVCSDPQGSCASYKFSDDKFHLVYEDEKALTLWAQNYWANGEAYTNKHFSDADRTRTREIKAAHERWKTDLQAAEDAAGITEPSGLGDREAEIAADLLRQIATTPAQSLEGMLAKGRASMLIHGRADLEERLSEFLAKPFLNWIDRQKIIALSLMIDAVRLGSDDCSTSRTQAAA